MMVTAESQRYLREFYRRFGRRQDLSAHLEECRQKVLGTRFDKQRSLIGSRARRRAGFCPRRSGKTEGNVGLLLDGALSGPDHLVLFVAKTRQRAVDLTWKAVESACFFFNVDSKANETRWTRTFRNGSVIRWCGADDLEELKKKRGDKLWRVVIDESQDFSFTILRTLVTDIFGPSLEDLGGDLILTGTPGEVCAGYWYQVTGGDPDHLKRLEGWELHQWTPLDNPHVPRIHARMRNGELAKEYGGEDSPTYQREWLGKWVRDTGALFYRFAPGRNTHTLSMDSLRGAGWQHVLGWDLGLRDAMAMVVWAFNLKRGRKLHEAWSWKKPGALVDECAAQVKWARATFNVVAMVADTGGGGAMFVEEVASRHRLSFEAAKKTEKAEHVRLFNDELQRGDIELMQGSPYAEEIAVLPKLLDWDEEKRQKPAPEDPRFENHCSDAGLYAWRRAYAYLHKPQEDAPPPGTPEAAAATEAKLERARTQNVSQRGEAAWWEM